MEKIYFPIVSYIECEKPVFDLQKCITGLEKFRRFVLNQDTGGAIHSPARVDLVAGSTKQKGSLFFPLKR